METGSTVQFIELPCVVTSLEKVHEHDPCRYPINVFLQKLTGDPLL